MKGPVRSSWLLCLGIAWVCGQIACVTDDGGDESGMQASESGMPTGAEPACAPRPEYDDVYSSCTGVATCNGGRICAHQEGMDPSTAPAFCTSFCTFAAECPVVDGCASEPICLTPSGGGTGVCALDCADGKGCPEGMECLEDEDNGGIRFLCF